MRSLSPAVLTVVLVMGLGLTAINLIFFGRRDNYILEFLVLLSVVVAASSFEKDDPPRSAWWTLTAAVGALLIGHVATPFTPNKTMSVRHVMIFTHNILWVLALTKFARNIHDSGMRPSSTRSSRMAFTAVAMVAGSVAMYAVVRIVAPVALAADPSLHKVSESIVNASAAIADAIVIILAVYLVRSLLPMRQGAVVQPYVLLAAGACGLLALDIASAVTGSTTYLSRDLFKVLHSVAWTSVGAAALSQAALVRRATHRSAMPKTT